MSSESLPQPVRRDEFGAMVRFAFRLGWVNLLVLILAYVVSVYFTSDGDDFTVGDAAAMLLTTVNLMAALVGFCLSVVGLFKARQKGQALVGLLLALLILAVWLLLVMVSSEL